MDTENISLEAEYHWKNLKEIISQATITIQRFNNYGAIIQNPVPVNDVDYEKFKSGSKEVIEDMKALPTIFQNWGDEASSFIEENLLEKGGRGGTVDAPA